MPSPIALDVSTEDRLFAGIIAIAHRSAIRFVDDQSAEDIAQDVAMEFLKLLACGALTREPRSLEAFTTRRAESRARNWLRRQANRAEREGDWARDLAERNHCWMRPDLMLSEAELADVERRAIEGMPPMRKRVFAMVRAGDRTYEQIAHALGVRHATVRYHVSEAQRQFRRELGAYDVRRSPTPKQVLARAGRTARARASGSLKIDRDQ